MTAAAPHTPGPTQRAIVTRQLTKSYGELTAVDHLDLEVHRGEVFGLLGPNGAGKTTTILMLLGLTEPSSGHARVLGLDPERQSLRVKRQVGYLPDNVGFYEGLTGRENLRYTARLNGLRRQAAEERIDELLERVGLADAADRRAGEYSRGMRQRLGIADTLVKDPAVVILDEPTIAIDPEGVTEILALIRWLAEDQGVAVLISSHLLHQVQSICDRVGVFVRGRLMATGSIPDLAQRFTPTDVTVEVSVEGTPERVEPVLAGLPAVTAVEADPRTPGLWRVTADRDPRPALTRALVEAGLTLQGLRRRGDALDELYHRWFAEEAGEGAPLGGAR